MGETGAVPEPEIYRRIIDWDRRLAHEGKFLLERLGIGPGTRVLDLGSATGEHDRWLAAHGARVVGVDRSGEMIAAARAAARDLPAIDYVEGDIAALPATIGGGFDAAICLGNTLVHLLDETALAGFAAGVASRLRDGGACLVQVLNYEAMLRARLRAMPPSFRPDREDGGGELVFLRLLGYPEPGFVEFESVVLRRGGGGPPELVSSRRSRLRAWSAAELVPALAGAVGPVTTFGGLDSEPFDPAASKDLVLLSRRVR